MLVSDESIGPMSCAPIAPKASRRDLDSAGLLLYPYTVVRSKAKITSKGQLTLPAAVRKALNVRAGDVVAFEIGPEGITLRTNFPADRFAKFAGKFRVGRGQSSEETNRWLREIRGRGKGST
jgi:AbrB family looped-hinge helix DNA binding protein